MQNNNGVAGPIAVGDKFQASVRVGDIACRVRQGVHRHMCNSGHTAGVSAFEGRKGKKFDNYRNTSFLTGPRSWPSCLSQPSATKDIKMRTPPLFSSSC